MSEDISNKTLVTLVLTALIVAVAGFFVAIQRPTITGLVTDTETAQGTIDLEANAVLTVTGTINFGKGRTNTTENATLIAQHDGAGGYNYCIVNDTAGCNPMGEPGGRWLNDSGKVGFSTTDFPNITITNDGGYQLNVTVSTTRNASGPLGCHAGGACWFCETQENLALDQSRIYVSADDHDATIQSVCDGIFQLSMSGTNYLADDHPVELCTGLNVSDSVLFGLGISVDANCEPTADWVNNTFTFVGDTSRAENP